MGKVIYIRSGDGVLLRFEDPARVRAWIASGRLALTDLHLGADQAWHPLSELIDLSGALVQAPAAAETPAPGPAPSDAIVPTAERPVVSPGKKRKNGGPTQRDTHPFRKTDLVPAGPAAGVPEAFPETLATAPLPAIRDVLPEPVPAPLPTVVPAAVPEPEPVVVPKAAEPVAEEAPAPADLDQPLVFPTESDPFPKATEGEWWASDPVGGAARKKAALRRTVLFGALVVLGVGGTAALVILTREASIPEIPPAPAASASEPAVAPPVLEAAPKAAVAPAEPKTVEAVAAPAPAKIEEAPVPAKDLEAAPAPTAAPVPEPAPAREPAPAPVPVKARVPEPAAKTASAAGTDSTGIRELPPAPRVSPSLREPSSSARPAAIVPPVPDEEPATYDGHMAAGNRQVSTNPAIALDHFRLAAQARPNRVEPVSRMGDCAVRMGDLENAEKHYKAALKLGASYAPALVGMARVQKARGSVTDARYYYTRYLEVNPKGAQADEAQSYLERNP